MRLVIGLALLVLVLAGQVLPGRADDVAVPADRPVDAETAGQLQEMARRAAEIAAVPPARLDVEPMQEPAPVPGTAPGGVVGAPEPGQAAGAVPAPGAPPAGVVDVLERAQAIGAATGRGRLPDGLGDVLERAAAAAAAAGGEVISREQIRGAADRDLVLFVSWSMGPEALRDTLREAAADGHTRVVLRGVLSGERMGDAVRRLAPLVAAVVPRAALEFDPPAFRKAEVVVVPTIRDPGTGSQWRGSVALAAFRKQLAAAVATFSEAVGPAAPVAEPDLEEVLKARAAGLDFAAMREEAFRRYWQKVAVFELPAAGISAERQVDPTVWLSAPLRDAAGRVVAVEGTRINALETHPWSRRLVVFDASDPKQLAWAALRAKRMPAAIFLTTGIDRAAGWDGWRQAVGVLGQPLFLLDALLGERLQLHAVPSVVEQDGAQLRVREIGRPEVDAELKAAGEGIRAMQGLGMATPVRRAWLSPLALLLALAITRPGWADQKSPECQDGSALSARILTSICWDCLFPIRLGGSAMFSTAPSSGYPAGATDQTVCICNNGSTPAPGITLGFWNPFQLIEAVRTPGCSVTLGGLTLPAVDPLQLGTKNNRQGDTADKSYYHYHSYSFPVLQMLNLLFDAQCMGGALSNFDILTLSEIDPTWTFDELAFFTAPESAAVALPPAQLACLTDAVAATAGQSLDDLFWCAGSWGSIYPFSGNANGSISPVANTSLLATRALAVQHRRGLAIRSMGNDALCGGVFEPLMDKSQYRMSMFWPLPEANGKHVIGQTPLIWGEWRQIPATGEDSVYLIWRWQDCCLGLLN